MARQAMGNSAHWTEEQYRAYLKNGGKPKKLGDHMTAPKDAGTKPRHHAKVNTDPKTRMNKTEAEYARILWATDGVTDVGFERIKLRLADGTWYTPDFDVTKDGFLELHEVKGGHVEDDARVKYKVAREQFPQFKFRWAQKLKNEWRYGGKNYGE